MEKKRKRKYDTIITKCDNIEQPQDLYDSTTDKNISTTYNRIQKRLNKLLEKATGLSLKNHTHEPNYSSLLEFETFLHYSDCKYQNKRKSIINKLISKPAFTSSNDIKAFFMPYFTNTAFNEYNSEYFKEFNIQLSDFLIFYDCLSNTTKASPVFKYVIDDLYAFISCLYTREVLPQRDYKKLYNLLINQ